MDLVELKNNLHLSMKLSAILKVVHRNIDYRLTPWLGVVIWPRCTENGVD